MSSPRLIALNHALASELGLDIDHLTGPEGAQILSGNLIPAGAEPLAQAYAGHQFGGWVPQLGDGRAILLGEVVNRQGQRRDIQLKGAGKTPFSRMGDGRAWLGPVLREYIVSEAMHAFGIPTTRALAAVSTGEQVLRETALPGAVLTRVAASHLRVGTFQYFAARGDTEALGILTDYALDRHYPSADASDSPALTLLSEVQKAQARLIARWMGVGFIHGVMNTDNMTISGETIDYGPCAFMDAYDPAQVIQFHRPDGALCLWQPTAAGTLEPGAARQRTPAADRQRRGSGNCEGDGGDRRLPRPLHRRLDGSLRRQTRTGRISRGNAAPRNRSA